LVRLQAKYREDVYLKNKKQEEEEEDATTNTDWTDSDGSLSVSMILLNSSKDSDDSSMELSSPSQLAPARARLIDTEDDPRPFLHSRSRPPLPTRRRFSCTATTAVPLIPRMPSAQGMFQGASPRPARRNSLGNMLRNSLWS